MLASFFAALVGDSGRPDFLLIDRRQQSDFVHRKFFRVLIDEVGRQCRWVVGVQQVAEGTQGQERLHMIVGHDADAHLAALQLQFAKLHDG